LPRSIELLELPFELIANTNVTQDSPYQNPDNQFKVLWFLPLVLELFT